MGVLVLKLILIYLLFSAVVIRCWSSLRLGLGGNATDRLVLLAIKTQIKQDLHNYNVMSSWNESTHFCMVTNLDLQSQNLVGKLSPNIGNLSFLRELRLRNNSFSHEIPPQIGNLLNSFSGSIPHNISYCFNLILVNFTRNKLVGKIPLEIGSLSKLQRFSLNYNNVTGQVPPSLGNLSSLRSLGLFSNNLMGNIPSSLGQLKKLTFLGLGLNQLSGSIPSSIYNLSSLVKFYVAFNQIQGSIPSDIGKSLPDLEFFSVFSNQLTGSIPPSISNITSVVPNLQKLHNLLRFNVKYNNIGSGKDGDLSFLSDLTNATQLQWLIINDNNFGGTLPMSISNLSTKLECIPSGIGNLVSLESLLWGDNSFTGNIPSNMGKLSNLGILHFSNNKLSGNIPHLEPHII
ncbi:unnamed protein product [Malus baccata var. baccata]